jgi:16S rRNA (cytosine1407-C5)-methyltransferase
MPLKQRNTVPHSRAFNDRALLLERTATVFGIKPSAAEMLMSLPRRQSVRLSPLNGMTRTEIIAALQTLDPMLEPIPWCPDGFHFRGDKAALVASTLFKQGHIYIQNAASLIPALALAPQPDQDILDLCAAPGGKSAHIAALTGNGARLWLNDGIPARVEKLKSVVALMGIQTHQITGHEAQYIDKFVHQSFDRILLDAQCSGEGMLDLRRSSALRYWSMERIQRYRRLQQRMVMAAYRLLRPGGMLVYSTCTFAPEENEAPLSHLLKHRQDISVQPITLNVPGRREGLQRWQGEQFEPALQDAVRIQPSTFLEGFFVCRLRKQG